MTAERLKGTRRERARVSARRACVRLSIVATVEELERCARERAHVRARTLEVLGAHRVTEFVAAFDERAHALCASHGTSMRRPLLALWVRFVGDAEVNNG